MDEYSFRDAAAIAKHHDRRLAIFKVALVCSGPDLVLLGLFLLNGNLRCLLWRVQC